MRGLKRLLMVVVIVACVLPGFAAAAPTSSGVAPTLSTRDVSTAYQQNPRHDGIGRDSSLRPPLRRKWAIDLSAYTPGTSPTVSAPIVARGKVFVTTAVYLTVNLIQAVDLRTGKIAWGPYEIGGSGHGSGLTYSRGAVFSVAYTGDVQARDADTGELRWKRKLPLEIDAPPIVAHGALWVFAQTRLYRLDPRTGSVLDYRTASCGARNPPAATADGVFLTTSDVFAWTPAGDPLWRHESPTFSCTGAVTVVSAGRVYARPDLVEDGLVLDARTGHTVGDFYSYLPPAVGRDRLYVLDTDNRYMPRYECCTLRALDLATGAEDWHYAPSPEQRAIIPGLVVNGTLYSGANDGSLFGLDTTTGAVQWQGRAPDQIMLTDEHNSGEPLTGLGSGGGYLLVPAHDWLVAYGPRAAAATLNASRVSFHGEPVGAVSRAARLTVTNTGASTLTVRGAALAGADKDQFRISRTTCSGVALEPSKSCAVHMVFAPTRTGRARAQLGVSTSSGWPTRVQLTTR